MVVESQDFVFLFLIMIDAFNADREFKFIDMIRKALYKGDLIGVICWRNYNFIALSSFTSSIQTI